MIELIKIRSTLTDNCYLFCIERSWGLKIIVGKRPKGEEMIKKMEDNSLGLNCFNDPHIPFFFLVIKGTTDTFHGNLIVALCRWTTTPRFPAPSFSAGLFPLPSFYSQSFLYRSSSTGGKSWPHLPSSYFIFVFA